MWVGAFPRLGTEGKPNVENHIHIAGFFLLSVLAAMIFWNFLIRGVAAHHAESPAWQALANLA